MTKKKSGGIALTIAAIGVVFGDIGTSPLYALQAVFGLGGFSPTPDQIYGIISLIIWAITLVVSVKYVWLIMKADNRGEGGIMSLVALLRKSSLSKRHQAWCMLLGIAGLALFYGDSIITPAISVLSATEGIKVVAPGLEAYIVPLTLLILGGLFALQHRGTSKIGLMFGPIMILWFVVSALGGLLQIFHHPQVLVALLPTSALGFIMAQPLAAFIAMAAVVLAITGAEALYADMGHFGRAPIQKAWFFLIFPALIINYLGQGALLSLYPDAISSSYFLLFPEIVRIPVLILAMLATLIASQAVIAGAFSLTRQAVRLGFAPPMLVRHTSKSEEGQVYIGALNWIIFAAVALLVLAFGSSARLAAAFGMAVSGTLLIDTILFLAVMALVWRTAWWKIVLSALIFVPIDVIFLSSSLSKFIHGGWIPVAVALIAFTLLTTWAKGRAIVSRARESAEESLSDFMTRIRQTKSELVRAPGVAVYLSNHPGKAPLALHATVTQLHELSRTVALVTVRTANIPHVAMKQRVSVDDLGSVRDNISHITITLGYNDVPNIPLILQHARDLHRETDFDPYEASYFISDERYDIARNHRMSALRKLLFVWLDRNATSMSDYYHLPSNRTVDIASHISL
jgi:KUP system potassium uptake protein